MTDFDEALRRCSLFEGIAEDERAYMLECMGAKRKKFSKGENIFYEGEKAEYFGIILSGSAQVVRVDYYGNRVIIANITPSELFGESFAFAGVMKLPVDAVAAADTEVLLIPARRVTETCSKACASHNTLVYNLLKITAAKNLMLHQRIEIISHRTTREKLMAYLLFQAKGQGSNRFSIPYDRQELADYLGVERSGLSVEISKLKRDKIIECRKNIFILL